MLDLLPPAEKHFLSDLVHHLSVLHAIVFFDSMHRDVRFLLMSLASIRRAHIFERFFFSRWS